MREERGRSEGGVREEGARRERGASRGVREE